MAEGLIIATAEAGDIAGIHRIEEASFPQPWRREFFESELVADGRLNLVARRNRQLAGYLFAMFLLDELHINKIAVEERERRRGVAQALMDRCFTFAREREIRVISLEVRQSNRGAIDFYRQLAFSSSYVRPRYYPDGEAAVVMTRPL
ncbi:MAG: [ribosomal protein S18]-alanine N-acetyltransferase [Acidobacteriota bacterium]|nr:[ribosomal protein S18]-alanine N-acetyltransferase [Acidobacteriota bacterium]